MLKNGQRNTRIILKTYRKNTNLRSEKSINLMSLNLNEFIKPFQSNYRERESRKMNFSVNRLNVVAQNWFGVEPVVKYIQKSCFILFVV